MKRWLFNIAAAISALAFVGLLALWIRSYFVSDMFMNSQQRGTHIVFDGVFASSSRGLFDFGRDVQGYDNPLPASLFERGILKNWKHETDRALSFNLAPFQSRFNRLGIRVATIHQITASPITDDATFIVVPTAYFTIFAAILPIIWLIRWIRRRGEFLPGYCRICGYDLRATPARCPECGAAATREM